MPFLTNLQEKDVTDKLTSDERELRKIFNRKKTKFHSKSIRVESFDEHEKKGWYIFSESPGGLRLNIRKSKAHSTQLEDNIWCMFYNLGYRHLNINEFLRLPHGKEPEDTKQIDIVAICPINKIVFIVECESSERSRKKPFKDEIDLLVFMKHGFTKSLHQIFGREYKVKLIFATKNFRIDRGGEDAKRMENSDVYHLNDNGYNYFTDIIKHYKHSSPFQFLGIIFHGQKINDEVLSIPALQGKMGNLEYYMFSIEPKLLLQIGRILHRVKANEANSPTYQRMLAPKKLKDIAAFLNDPKAKNFFPNSVILNFNQIKRININFEAGHSAGKIPKTSSKFGILKIPMAYAIANIIDGQHRIYGYSAAEKIENDTIPVVAFKEMSNSAQLKMFMDINENQKPVNPSLRFALQKDLHWNSERLDQKMAALKSAIITAMGDCSSSILNTRVEIGEDKAELKFKPFYSALGKSLLVPTATEKKFDKEKCNSALYDIANHDIDKAMHDSVGKVFSLINSSYKYVSENFPSVFNQDSTENLIISNRGSFAFVRILGSLNSFLTNKGLVSLDTSNKDRFSAIEEYLMALCKGIESLEADEKRDMFLFEKGRAAENLWFFGFQYLINQRLQDYQTEGLMEWLETKDKQIQENAKNLVSKIEKHMKDNAISNLKLLFGKSWELECGKVYIDCGQRMKENELENHNLGIHNKKYVWTDYFMILDYKKLIAKNWGKKPEQEINEFNTFQSKFSVDLGEGIRTQKIALAWVDKFNSFRKIVAHEGTKEIGLNLKEVELLEDIYDQLLNN